MKSTPPELETRALSKEELSDLAARLDRLAGDVRSLAERIDAVRALATSGHVEPFPQGRPPDP
ncbi:hypothetical protein ACWGQ5_14825 [Streptomyces sp. NPDC055722]